MKKTEQRWMRTDDGHMTERDFIPTPAFAADYELVTVTYDEPEWEEVEVVRWVVVNTSDKSECFTSHSEKMCEDWMKNVREPEKLNIVRLSNTYRRRKPEPEVWEGKVYESLGKGYGVILELPYKWIDKCVRVEVIDD